MTRRLGPAPVAVLLMTLAAGSLTSCGDAARTVTDAVSSDDEQAQDALDDYRDELSSLGPREQRLLDRYGSVQGKNYTTDRAMYRVVAADLPKWTQLSDDLQMLEIEDDELADIHSTYIDATSARIRGFTLLLAAMEDYDLRAMADANDAIGEGNQLVREWQQDLEEFMEEVEG